ncbi:MAG: peptidylprolyl isomerase [Acidimicrobiia bacterium]|nr:peptidylprolyl isomerase [Acidimicrobiia bacterium]
MSLDPTLRYSATLDTSCGRIELELQAERSPLAVNNFVFLAREGYYDDCPVHRVVPGFVVQAGDPTGTGRGGPGYRFADELEGRGQYREGTLAMANAGPNTNGSQFFICLAGVSLPHSYTIFGHVTAGMDTVHAFAALPRRGEQPKGDAKIHAITIHTEAANGA